MIYLQVSTRGRYTDCVCLSQCCVPEGSGLREFVSRSPKVRLHCTMLRHEDNIAANCYTLYLEYLGGLVPLLKGKRTSKLKPEFVIFDPQVSGESNVHYLLLHSLIT